MELAPYAADANSVALYIGHPQVKAVHFQRTESGNGLLDIEIVRSADSPAGKLLPSARRLHRGTERAR